jgi:hypothetical protein
LQQHIIHKIKVNAITEDAGHAFSVQQKLRACIEGELQRKITALLSTYDTGDDIIVLDNISINTGDLQLDELEKNFPDRCVQLIRQEIEKAVQHNRQETTAAAATASGSNTAAAANEWYAALLGDDDDDDDDKSNAAAGDHISSNDPATPDAPQPGNDNISGATQTTEQTSSAVTSGDAAPATKDQDKLLQQDEAALTTEAATAQINQANAAAHTNAVDIVGTDSNTAWQDESWQAGDNGALQPSTPPGNNATGSTAQNEPAAQSTTTAASPATGEQPLYADESWHFDTGSQPPATGSAIAGKADAAADAGGTTDAAPAANDELLTEAQKAYVTGMDKRPKAGTEQRKEKPTGLSPSGLRRIAEALGWFLEKGSLPWWMPAVNGSKWHRAIAETAATYPALVRDEMARAFANSHKAFRRWVTQLPPLVQLSVAEAIMPGLGQSIRQLQHDAAMPAALAQLLRALQQLLRAAQQQEPAFATDKEMLERLIAFWRRFVQQRAAAINVAQLQQLMQEAIAAQADAAAGATATADAKAAESEPAPAPVYTFRKLSPDANAPHWFIGNAGLVLLHPFLKILFSNFSLLDEQDRFRPGMQARAVYILHYCATGQTQGEEYEMVLNKVLCGLQTDDVIERDVVISATEKAECDHLLQTVINYWTALKGTSPDGLRGTFVLREGKLSDYGDEWQLTVTQKTMDILMGQLPWGISMIRLPWMQKLMKVEWY